MSDSSSGHWIFAHAITCSVARLKKIDEKSMQLNLTLCNESQSQEKIHTS